MKRSRILPQRNAAFRAKASGDARFSYNCPTLFLLRVVHGQEKLSQPF